MSEVEQCSRCGRIESPTCCPMTNANRPMGGYEFKVTPGGEIYDVIKISAVRQLRSIANKFPSVGRMDFQ